MTAEEKDVRLQDPMLRGIDIMKTYDERKPYLLCLQDPADPTNDLGKKAFGIKHVQKMFREFSQQLRDQMKMWDESKDKSPYGLLGNFLEADYTVLDYDRSKMREWVIKRDPSLTATFEEQFPPAEYRLGSKAMRAIKRDKRIMERRLAAGRKEPDSVSTSSPGNHQQQKEIASEESGKEELQVTQSASAPQQDISPLDTGTDAAGRKEPDSVNTSSQGNHQQQEEIANGESGKEELQAIQPATALQQDISPPDTDTDVPGLEEKQEQPKIEPRSWSGVGRPWKRWDL